ncbi:hypothetical protein ACJJIP_04225 [Microbulbifer sp. VTAC004]|uniref:hypothetical protein n=1 Tax=Microbulbifer sp. VTAC004 TaxID=3243386 RepID=UPI004039B0AE
MSIKLNALPLSSTDNDIEIERVVSTFSEGDREELSSGLIEVLGSSDIVKILDENRDSGPGSLREVLRVCRILGKTDASLAWIAGVSNSAWTMRGCFHSLEAQPYSMERNKILAMVLGRPGSLKKNPTSNQWLLNGEWRYASGSTYASYFFCLATVEGADTQDIQVVAVPAEQLDVAASWNSAGLRGTQSLTVRARDIEIPNSNVENYSHILSGENRRLNALAGREEHASYAGLFTGVLMNCLVGSMLGATEAGLEYVAAAAGKHPVLGSTYTSMSDSGAIRSEIGRLWSSFDIYQRAAEFNADTIDHAARKPEITLTTEDRLAIRGRATQIMRGCLSIVQDLLWIYGASGLDIGSPLERIWRDVNVGARHGGFSKFVPEEAIGLSRVERDPKELTRMF